ncbi:MAG: 1,6-anhydro-N-acetylmuramyl-L-alanine amidase AmpD [Gammaproteobacteria bacterium]|nr:1,6-anhydro-N-acetylmuramyl-L-alanine amidase AmpD [Gammaproteobacteria bacterium]
MREHKVSVDDHGWLNGVARIESPNYDCRPARVDPTLVVVHGISLPAGHFGGDEIHQLFTNTLQPNALIAAEVASLRVSAHALIRRDAQVVQYVSFRDRAWHAGVSEFDGQERCNDFSIGIELEGTDHIPYEPAQYAALAAIFHALQTRWPALRPERVVGHSDIAPGRKTDPGPAFRWETFYGALNAWPPRAD